MKIKFRDVSSGVVEARAVIEIASGIYLNEVTLLSRNNQIEVELPQKSFKGKSGKFHHLDIVTFENEDKKTLWQMEVREKFLEWRKGNKKVLVYES
ncbi:MAG: hypothetical protein K8S56_10190 [Candidatus Cloacimonetes bacterium]|nr:hypothetical protein [Candidatus Cloacimonadota bacterium]